MKKPGIAGTIFVEQTDDLREEDIRTESWMTAQWMTVPFVNAKVINVADWMLLLIYHHSRKRVNNETHRVRFRTLMLQ